MVRPTTLKPPPPPGSDSLQPLREVGSLEKTQYWDREDIMEALRIANLRGIPIESLRSKPSSHTARIPVLKRP